MATSSYNFIINTGTVVADTTELLADVQAEYKNALGQNIDLAPATPQGTMIAGETTARTSVMKNNADLANVINPELSYGVFLDAICALLGVPRGSNQSTIAQGVLVSGTANTIILAGARVISSDGDIFLLSADTTIPIGGSIRADFQSQAFGIIPVPLGNFQILDGTIGWGSAIVDGTTDVIPGTLSLGDAQLKTARRQQLATQGIGSSAAIKAAVSQVANVTSSSVVENNTGTAGVHNGINFTLPNAMWVCVAGAFDKNAVAEALYSAHAGGCPWDYGAAGMGVPVDPTTGTSVNDPATNLPYFVKFTTPVLYDVYVNIKVRQIGSVSSPAPAVQAAILAYATGQEQGEEGLVIGASISAFEMAGAVARQIPGMYVQDCKIAVVTQGSPAPAYPGAYVTEFPMLPYQQGTVASNNITVTEV